MNNVYMGMDVEDFIFGEGTTYEEDYNVSEEEMNEFGVIECAEDPDVACYRIALENEQNYNAIMTAALSKELNHVLENGTEMVYEAVDFKGFFAKVKKQIQKFWAKVKGVFKKVMDNISSIVLSNKAFVKKYRASANKLKAPKGKIEFTGYDFSKGHLALNFSTMVDVVSAFKGISVSKEDIENSGNAKKEVLDHARGVMVGDGSVSAEDFGSKLKVYIYGSENTQTIPLEQNFSTLLDRLETAKDARQYAQNSYKEAEKSIKKMLSEVKDAESKAKSDIAAKTAKFKAECISGSITVMSTAMSVLTKAFITLAVQDRKMANAWVRSQPVKESTVSEGVTFDDVVII